MLNLNCTAKLSLDTKMNLINTIDSKLGEIEELLQEFESTYNVSISSSKISNALTELNDEIASNIENYEVL